MSSTQGFNFSIHIEVIRTYEQHGNTDVLPTRFHVKCPKLQTKSSREWAHITSLTPLLFIEVPVPSQ